jgi:hypothetical protein
MKAPGQDDGHTWGAALDSGSSPRVERVRRSSSGSLAMLTAIRRASSRVSKCEAERLPAWPLWSRTMNSLPIPAWGWALRWTSAE